MQSGRIALASVIASLGSIGAGLYLVLTKTQSSDSVFKYLLHGIGVYFIAKGFFLGPSLWHSATQTRYLELIARGEQLEPSEPTREKRGGWRPLIGLVAFLVVVLALIVLANR